MPVVQQSGNNSTAGTIPKWLEWAREIQAIAQTGYHYSSNEFDQQRYNRLMKIAAEITSSYSNLDLGKTVDLYRAQIGYATPRIDTRGAVFKAGKLLLVRERMDGGWTMPGGWVDVGETPSRAVEREVWEESGFQVHATRVIGVYDANRAGALELFHAFKIIFACELVSGEALPSNETSEVDFFERDKIPAPLSSQRTNTRFIDDAFNCLEYPDCPAVFD